MHMKARGERRRGKGPTLGWAHCQDEDLPANAEVVSDEGLLMLVQVTSA